MEQIDPVDVLPTLGKPLVYNTDFTCTAKSKTENLERLFDDNLTGYYQTDASCPHWVCCHFTKPTNLVAFAIYLNSEDSSYKPERMSLSSSEDGTDNRVDVTLTHKTGWFVIPYKYKSVSVLRFSSDHNYTGGCDCRMHQVALFASQNISRDTLKHQQCLVSDLASLKDDMELADLELRSNEKVKTIKCHSIVVAACSELMTTMFSKVKERSATGRIILYFKIPYKLLKIFVNFAYDGGSILHKYLENDELVLPTFYAPECVVSVFGNAAPLLALGRCLMCTGIANIAGEHILARTSKLVEVGGSLAAWRWLGSMAPTQLTSRIGNVLADAIATSSSSCSGLLCSITPDQLRAILRCSITNAEITKGCYVKLRSTASISCPPAIFNEVGVVKKTTGDLVEVKFSSIEMKVATKDLVVVNIN